MRLWPQLCHNMKLKCIDILNKFKALHIHIRCTNLSLEMKKFNLSMVCRIIQSLWWLGCSLCSLKNGRISTACNKLLLSLYMNHCGSTWGGFDPKGFQMTPLSRLAIVFAQLSAQFQPKSLMHEVDDEVAQELWVSPPFFKTGQGHL